MVFLRFYIPAACKVVQVLRFFFVAHFYNEIRVLLKYSKKF
jgi:hypothetical protein